jgi:transposase InsO family protein
MEQRIQLVADYGTGFFTVTELADEYGVSRKTAYKWINRASAAEGTGTALRERSRRPRHSPGAIDAAVVARLIALRKRYPRWGAKKLLVVGARLDPHATWPKRSTVCDLLTRAGLVTPRPRRRRIGHSPSVLAPMTAPNTTWTTDFKGEFRTGDRRYCYPLTLRDGHSRFVLQCAALLARTYDDTRRRFARAFAQYGLPDRIRSDNGGPFAAPGLGRLSRLSVWWMRLGIVPERIAPGHPEQNGSHEQFHSVLKADTAWPPAPNLRAQQRRFDRFAHEYNFDRPHEALDDQSPASCYTPSARRLPGIVPPLDYPGHFALRRVSTNGCISWKDRAVFLTESLAGDLVGFEEVGDALWTIYFGSVALARFNERRRQLQPLAAITTGREPTGRLAPARKGQ